MSGRSAIYRGRVRHRRFAPRRHEFGYDLSLLALDLDDLPDLFDGMLLVSARRPAPWRYHRADYHGDPSRDLREAVRDSIEEATGFRPTGPILLCTQIRALGFRFNPVSFYFAYEGDEVAAVLAEITNTPWLERHHYVLGRAELRADGGFESRFAKRFHVSPFMPMAQDYHWFASRPDQRLTIHMRNIEDGARVFDATMTMTREPLTRESLRRTLLRQPFLGLRIAFAIYWQALRLKLKGIPFFDHPTPLPEKSEEEVCS